MPSKNNSIQAKLEAMQKKSFARPKSLSNEDILIW